MAVYAIGDIHGCLGALKTIFNEGMVTTKDRVIFLGDYVDRGPDSKGVLDWLIEHQTQYHFEFILGNHDMMMLHAKSNPHQLAEWLHVGGNTTLDSYGIGNEPDWVNKIDEKHWKFLESCKPYYQYNQYLFVHAGLEPGKKLEEQDENHLFWKKFETPKAYAPDRKVICGHTSRKNGEIANFGHTICIDTYAYGGMWLTCLNVETNQYIKTKNNGTFTTGKL